MDPKRYVPDDAGLGIFLKEYALLRFEILPW
jgi:hypothetical protein